MYFNLIQMIEAYNGYQQFIYFTCNFMVMNYAYTFTSKAETTQYIEKFLNFIKNQYSANIQIFYIDNKLALDNQFQYLIVIHSIIFELLALYTLMQNSLTKYSREVIITHTCAMRIDIKLSKNLQPKLIIAVVYLMNLTPIK